MGEPELIKQVLLLHMDYIFDAAKNVQEKQVQPGSQAEFETEELSDSETDEEIHDAAAADDDQGGIGP